MKSPLDENLSRRLVPFLQVDCPGTTQVYLIADFKEPAALRGMPPQIIWLRMSNPAKSKVLDLPHENRATMEVAFQAQVSCIGLGSPQGTPHP